MFGPELLPPNPPARPQLANGTIAARFRPSHSLPGGDTLLFSGGDDGYVRGWRLSDVLAGLQARELKQQQQQQQQQAPDGSGAGAEAVLEVRPFLAVRLPRAESPLGAISLPPAVQSLALSSDPAGEGSGPTTLFAGELPSGGRGALPVI